MDMKKTILLLVAAVCYALNISAQGRVIFCEQFEYIRGEASEADMIKVRSAALEGVSRSGRASIIDATKSEIGAQRGKTTEEVMQRRQAIKVLGATHILDGRVNSCTTKREVVKSDDKTRNEYTTTINFTITLTSMESGKQITWDREVSNDEYDDEDKAYSGAVKKIHSTLYEDIRAQFPLYAHLLDEEFNKDDEKKETCLISLGRAANVKVGDYFSVYEVSQIAGEDVETKVGEIEVTAIVGQNVSRCKVKKGGKEIQDAMKDYFNNKKLDPEHARPLQIKSSPKGETVLEKVVYTTGGIALVAVGAYSAFLEELSGTTTE